MPRKKKIKSKVKNDKTVKNNGLSKIAKITTTAIIKGRLDIIIECS